MFQAGTLGYYAQYITLSYLAGLQNQSRHILAGGTGSFGYEPDVDYLFGVPRAIRQGGIALNKPIINITGQLDNNVEQNINYNMQIGMLSSALEYITPVQIFTDQDHPGEAVSAISAIQKASQQGQSIYQISQQNIQATLPNIHHDSDTMNEIRNAVSSGKIVIIHTDAIQVPGWSGAGYIILDSETGAGAYKIAGGGDGGELNDNMASAEQNWMSIAGMDDIVGKSQIVRKLVNKIERFIDNLKGLLEIFESCNLAGIVAGLAIYVALLVVTARFAAYMATAVRFGCSVVGGKYKNICMLTAGAVTMSEVVDGLNYILENTRDTITSSQFFCGR